MNSAKAAPRHRAKAALLGALLASTLMTPAAAQIAPNQTAAGTNRALKLAPDSPFRDPDVIYLEADELINDEAAQILTASGEVEGRYQDRTLRADRVDYNLETGLVLATGNVVLIDATGDVQYADKLELSDELQAGTAANFTARLANGGTTAARFVTRSETGEFELFNATYTACEICKNSEGDTKSPSWRLRARKVRQDEDTRTIRYNDAVLELFGIPVFYTPYLAHPDPSRDRASGLLTPTIGISSARGGTLKLPYYWAIDDYSELTITPHLFTDVNPLLELQGRRQFATGQIKVEASATYETAFDGRGRALDNPDLFIDPLQAEQGDELSSHFFLDGYFRPNQTWSYGYTAMLSSDDNYLRRYDISSGFAGSGPIQRENFRNTSQAFIAGQGDNFRVSALAFGFQDLRTRFIRRDGDVLIRQDDRNEILPIVAPRLDGEFYLPDPILQGRARLFGNATYLTREEGNDYGRTSIGADYSKTMIAPGGIEVKPFLWGRFDAFDFTTVNEDEISFDRTIGQAGVDVRYPFLKRGQTVDWILEPRLLYTESFGNARTEEFVDPVSGASLFEDGDSPSLDTALLFSPNKADGYDFFQEGRRLDVGASVKAAWQMAGRDTSAEVFLGRSYSDNVEDSFSLGSGLSGTNSDYVAEINLDVSRLIKSNTRLRYDDDRNTFSRIDSTLSLNTKYVSLRGRYYTLNTPPETINPIFDAPPEEISGTITIRPVDHWSFRYSAVRDLDSARTNRQTFGIGYRDDCTNIELFWRQQNSSTDALNNSNSVGIRVTLATLGSFGSN